VKGGLTHRPGVDTARLKGPTGRLLLGRFLWEEQLASPHQVRGLGNAVSSPIGVRGEAQPKLTLVCFETNKMHMVITDFVTTCIARAFRIS